MSRVAFRASPALAPTEYRTSPLPLPDGFCTLSQAAPDEADQRQPASVETPTEPDDAAAPIVSLALFSSKRHGAPSSAMRTRASLIETTAARDAASGLGRTENATFALPCPPAADVKASQALSLVASQAHSRSVVTVKTPFPPLEENVLVEADAETTHLLADGPTVLVDAEPQPGSRNAGGNTIRKATRRGNRLARMALDPRM